MATRQYASSYTGADGTFVRSYLSTTAHTPLTSFSTAYEGTFGGYSGHYLKDTSNLLHGFIKAYTSETGYTKIYNKVWAGAVLTNYTKQWAGNTSFMGGLEYLKMWETEWTKTYTGVYTKLWEKDYNKDYETTYTKIWEKAYTKAYTAAYIAV